MNDSRFHVSLHVASIERSVAFYRRLFDVDPARHREDYAKFETASPALVLSLLPGAAGRGGALDHLGWRVEDAGALVAVQQRLEAAGLPTIREDGVACCQSRQTKFWVRDPDGVLWEIYRIEEGSEEEDEHERPAPRPEEGATHPIAERIWSHAIGESLVLPLAETADSIDGAELEGSLNDRSCPIQPLFAELHRILKPGREIRLHGLTADATLGVELPPLPGPAAVVGTVPSHAAVLDGLGEAGFIDLRITYLSKTAHFDVDGTALREIRLSARKPGFRGGARGDTVIYLGPFAAVRDDAGHLFRRGEPVALVRHDRLVLEGGGAKDAFLLLP